jgi:hypothetical protein
VFSGELACFFENGFYGVKREDPMEYLFGRSSTLHS